MKRILHLTTAALFGASMLATPVLAQTTSKNATQETGTAVEGNAGVLADDDADVGAETTASVDADFDTALGLIGDTDTTAEIAAMSDVGEIRVQSFSTLANTHESRGSLQTTLTERETEIGELQAAIAANESAMTQLDAQGVAAEDVVAAEVTDTRGLQLYTR